MNQQFSICRMMFTSWLACLGLPLVAQQDTRLHVNYQISSEVAVGSGDYTAYQLVANRYDVLSHQANTGYLRAALGLTKELPNGMVVDGGLDLVSAAHAKHPFYLHQLYARLEWRGCYIEAGLREQPLVVANPRLSSGAVVGSANARPIPQLHIGTEGFRPIPLTKNRLQVLVDFGYGYFLDDDWKSSQFDRYHALHAGSFLTTEVWYHQKKLYFRTNPEKPFSFTFGMSHHVQFGGKKLSYETGRETITNISPDLRDFFQVLIPSGDEETEDLGAANFITGNHVGCWIIAPSWKLPGERRLTAYLENPFEDGSGIRKGNQWDGLWGVEYRNEALGPQWLRGVVLELLNTMDQSGPIHWAPKDFRPDVGDVIPDEATGNDNYFDHYFYNGFAYYGQSLGTPLLTSPVYNKDGYLSFRENRVWALHLGMEGELDARWSYLLKGSYREGRGTYFVPAQRKNHSFDCLLEASYRLGSQWQLSAGYGLSCGNIMGDCSTFDFKAVYHGKIL